MASFTDNIPTFNPYVAQQPVDAMVKVGMMKQQQHDTNYQKIQQSMSTIAGLPIAKDVDKAYLQNKMDEIGGRLKTFASADLSSNQLTSNLRGMIGGIANDEIVQNSVRSTMALSKAKQQQAFYASEGTGSPSNDWLLNKSIEEYYNDESEGASFNGSIKPYTDFNKHALEIVKEVLEDNDIKDSDFSIDAEGNVTFSDVMVQTKLAGRSKEKIQTALLAGLTPADWQQMSVDGRYQYSNMDGPEFEKNIIESYSNNSAKLKKEKIRLEEQYNVAASPYAKHELSKNIASIDKAIATEKSSFEMMSKYFNEDNFEGAKAKLFTTNWMSNISNSMSSVDNSETLHTSPRAEFRFNREKEGRRRQEWTWEFDRDGVQMGIENSLNLRKIQAEELANRISLGGIAGGYGPVLNPQDQETVYKASPQKLQVEIDATKLKLQEEKDNIATYYTLSEQDFMRKMGEESFSKTMQTITGKEYPTHKDYTDSFIRNQEILYDIAPGEVKSKFKTFFETKQIADRILATKQGIKDDAIEIADEKFNITKILEEEDLNKSISMTNEEGETFTVSPESILAFEAKFKQIKKDINMMAGTGTEYYDPANPAGSIDQLNKIAAHLSPSERKLLQMRLNNTAGQGLAHGWGDNMDETETGFNNDINKILNKYDDTAALLMAEKAAFEADYVTARLTGMQGQSHSIDLSKTKPESGGSTKFQEFQSTVFQLAENAELRGLENTTVTGEKLKLIADDMTSAFISIKEGILQDEKDEYRLNVRGGGGSATILLDQDNYNSIFQGQFDRDPLSKRFLEYRQKIQANSNDNSMLGTTASDGKVTNQENAYLKNVDFPGISIFGVSGNLVTDNGLYYDLELNLYDPIERRWVENIEYTVSPQLDTNLQTQMLRMSDEVAFELLYGRKPAEGEIEELKSLLQNSLY